jgi:hypothetical protein
MLVVPSFADAQSSPSIAGSPTSLSDSPTTGSSLQSGDTGAAQSDVSVEPGVDESLLPSRDGVGRPPPETRWLLIGTGVAATGLFYAGAYGISEAWPEAPGRNELRYPIAGPFMDLARTGCPANDSRCSTLELVLRTVLVSLDALGQVGGLGLILQGAILGTGNSKAQQGLAGGSAKGSNSFSITPVPWSDGRSAGGLSLTGRF